MKPKIILISGKQGSGKSSLSQSLSDGMDGLVEKMRFAKTLYDMHDQCLPILKHAGLRPQSMEKDGELLQVLGTEYGRKYLGENVWAKNLRLRVNLFLCSFPQAFVVIDDTRFENEFDIFKDAFKVRLECDEELRKKRCSYWSEDTNHPSEIGLDKYAATPGKFDITLDTGVLTKHGTFAQTVNAFKEWIKL